MRFVFKGNNEDLKSSCIKLSVLVIDFSKSLFLAANAERTGGLYRAKRRKGHPRDATGYEPIAP